MESQSGGGQVKVLMMIQHDTAAAPQKRQCTVVKLNKNGERSNQWGLANIDGWMMIHPEEGSSITSPTASDISNDLEELQRDAVIDINTSWISHTHTQAART